jgi:hypothetical protein
VTWSAEPVEDVPLGVVTVMSTVPAAWAGAVATRAVSESTVKLVAATLPKLTAVAPVKPEPSTVTTVVPLVLAEEVESEVTEGAEALVKVNWSAEETVEEPVGVETMTSTVVADWDGATAVIW